MGESNQVIDELEMISNNNQRGNEPLCDEAGSSAEVRMVRTSANIVVGTPLLILFTDGTWTMREVTGVLADAGTPGQCDSGTHTRLQFNQGTAFTQMNNLPGNNEMCKPNGFGQGNCPANPGAPPNVEAVAFAEVIRWRIRNAADGVPELQRFSSNMLAADLDPANAPAPANPGWRSLVRGIEDLQVTYTQMNGNVSPPTTAAGAPPVVIGTYNSLVTRVQVTLWSRATGPSTNLAGLRISGRPGGPAAYRGSLTAIVTPSAALTHIANQLALASPSPSPTPAWQ
jgi:hypothetical protein